jgi:hypothetical protein
MATPDRTFLTHDLDGDGNALGIRNIAAPEGLDDGARLRDIDHEVKATPDDTTHGALIDEVEGAGGVTIDVHTVAGKPKVRFTGPTIPTGVGLSTEDPLEDGIANPGDTSSGQATAKRHVHPDKDTVGGDLYFIDAVAAAPIVYYATDIIPWQGADPRFGIAPVGAWDIGVKLTQGIGQG